MVKGRQQALSEFVAYAELCMRTIKEKEPQLIEGVHPNAILFNRRYGLGMAYTMMEIAIAICNKELKLARALFLQALGMARIFDALPPGSEILPNVRPNVRPV